MRVDNINVSFVCILFPEYVQGIGEHCTSQANNTIGSTATLFSLPRRKFSTVIDIVVFTF